MSSYPTYEEWKLVLPTIITLLKLSSYPTYEEWKRYHSTLKIVEQR